MELEKDITLFDFMKEMKHRSVLIQIMDNNIEVEFNELGLCENLVKVQQMHSRKIALIVPYYNPRNRLIFRIYLRGENSYESYNER